MSDRYDEPVSPHESEAASQQSAPGEMASSEQAHEVDVPLVEIGKYAFPQTEAVPSWRNDLQDREGKKVLDTMVRLFRDSKAPRE
jgi:hypothetical protein